MRYHDIELRSELLKMQFPFKVEICTEGSMPQNSDPDAYIVILNNGSATSDCSLYGMIEQNLLISIHVRLLSSGITNKTKEDIIIRSIFDRFKNTVILGDFTYSIDKANLLNSSTNVYSGYSNRIISIVSRFFNK